MTEERVDLKGWKGKDEIQLYERKDCYRLVEHRKEKESGENYENEHIIPKKNVILLWDIIRKSCDYRAEYKYRFLVRKLLEIGLMDLGEVVPSYKPMDAYMKSQGRIVQEMWYEFVTNISMETFNGGKFRRYIYFPYLYYPLKILEAKGFIAYFGKGGFMKITEDERGDML